MSVVHVVVPDGIDNPARPSGGNIYDRRICRGLAVIGWSVHEHAVPGSWPRPDGEAVALLAGVIAGIPDGAVVLLDGLIASTVPEVLVPEARRLCVVVLMHMPLGDAPPADEVLDARARERAVLSAVAAVITTSTWTRRRLLDRHALEPSQVHVAEPGVDAADIAPGTAAGGELLCVAAVTPQKGHDVLLDALATITELPWRCRLAGTLSLDPTFADNLQRQAREDGIGDRVKFMGTQVGNDLEVVYATADVLVLASRAETYGMVVTEALAHGLPVIGGAIGGLPEALGRVADGTRPGLLVRSGDPEALAGALSAWLADADLRLRLRHAAQERRQTLPPWSSTTARISKVLAEVAAHRTTDCSPFPDDIRRHR